MVQSMLQTIKHTTRAGVRIILDDFPETRNDDRLLCLTYWKVIDHVEQLDDIQHATTPEAIRRARQWLNERGYFLATDEEVMKRRRQSAVEMKKGITKI